MKAKMKAKFDASITLKAAQEKHQIKLEALVAETAIWAHPNVHERLIFKGSAARYPHIRRVKAGKEKRGQNDAGLRFDGNSYANNTIKWAIGANHKDIHGYETCHIWPKTCYDERYHTAVANLVLLPRALAGLTDHLPHIQQMLQYRAYTLYNWYPEEFGIPVCPEGYSDVWRPPESDILETKKRSNGIKKESVKSSFEEFVLPIFLDPKNQEDFKRALLVHRLAEIEIFYADGQQKKQIWNANKFKSSSNVLGNLRSRPEFRQGKWQKLGITKILVSIVKQ